MTFKRFTEDNPETVWFAEFFTDTFHFINKLETFASQRFQTALFSRGVKSRQLDFNNGGWKVEGPENAAAIHDKFNAVNMENEKMIMEARQIANRLIEIQQTINENCARMNGVTNWF